MIRHFTLLFLILLSHALLASSFNDTGYESNQEEFLPVEEAYQLNIDFMDGQLVLIWELADTYYLYRHGFKHFQHIDGQQLNLDVTIPQGIEKQDEYFGLVQVYYQQVVIEIPKKAFKGQNIILEAESQGCADGGLCYPPYQLYFEIDFDKQLVKPLAALPEKSEPVKTLSHSESVSANTTLWVALISAFIGGLILNLMPCVFPVLSIKLIQLVKHNDSAHAKIHGLFYMAGVILSFIGIAAIMLSLRTAGDAIGWGFQLQNPIIVCMLVYLFFLLAMNMYGLFEFGTRLMGVGEGLANNNGKSGAFFTGVLAVIVASPCTAPFMGVALGYAITQSSITALLVFAALGFGMAFPLTALTFMPSFSQRLPKPGLWMERLKQFFAFPLLITALWLSWILGNQVSSNAMAFAILGCIALAFATWCWKSQRLPIRALGVIALLPALWLPFNIKTPQTSAHVAYTEENLQELRNNNQAVFVDLTADWCITCIVNEKSTLETDEVQQAFANAGITYMVGDWTDYNPEITALLEKYQRSGIPLYLLYPADAGAEAIILPQILTKSIVLEAISSISK